jgi:hypothetical protein
MDMGVPVTMVVQTSTGAMMLVVGPPAALVWIWRAVSQAHQVRLQSREMAAMVASAAEHTARAAITAAEAAMAALAFIWKVGAVFQAHRGMFQL